MERFWNKVEKTETCWVWTAGLDDAGYGQFKFEGKNVKSHRMSYYLTHGHWPDITRHSCDNPSCVRPDHLSSGTQADNVDDKISRSRTGWRFSDEEVRSIRSEVYDDTVISRVCEKYSVPPDCARNMLSGATYQHVGGGRPVPRQNYTKRLTPEQVDEIRRETSNPYWGQQTILAAKYNVSRNMIWRIQHGIY